MMAMEVNGTWPEEAQCIGVIWRHPAGLKVLEPHTTLAVWWLAVKTLTF